MTLTRETSSADGALSIQDLVINDKYDPSANFRGLSQNRSPENLCFRVMLSVPAFVLGSLGNITSP
jgi:hypothetical protein